MSYHDSTDLFSFFSLSPGFFGGEGRGEGVPTTSYELQAKPYQLSAMSYELPPLSFQLSTFSLRINYD
ncbi:MAG TPA: hypothetical protein DCL08_01775 [Anaerolineaceae bacterium]|nr:hypothetical protein [Anaerolineaceae bacterium]